MATPNAISRPYRCIGVPSLVAALAVATALVGSTAHTKPLRQRTAAAKPTTLASVCEAELAAATRERKAGNPAAVRKAETRCMAEVKKLFLTSSDWREITEAMRAVARQDWARAGLCHPAEVATANADAPAHIWPVSLADEVSADCAAHAEFTDALQQLMGRLEGIERSDDTFSGNIYDPFSDTLTAALRHQHEILLALATLPPDHVAAVAPSWVPPWNELDGGAVKAYWAAVESAIRQRLASGRGEPIPPAAKRWLDLAARGRSRTPGVTYQAARLLLRNGQTSVPSLSAEPTPSAYDGAALAWAAFGEVLPGEPADQEVDLLRQVMVIGHGAQTAEAVLAPILARKAHCDRPSRPCQPLRLATMPPDATMTIRRISVGCFSTSGEEYELVLQPKPAIVWDDGTRTALTVVHRARIDIALNTIASLTSGGCTTRTKYIIEVKREGTLLARDRYVDATCSAIGNIFYELGAAGPR